MEFHIYEVKISTIISQKPRSSTSSRCSKWVRFEMARHTPCCLLAYAPRQAQIAIIPNMRPMIRAAASPPSNAETWSKRQAKTNAKNTWNTPPAAIFNFYWTGKGTWWATYDVIVRSEWKRTRWDPGGGGLNKFCTAQNQFLIKIHKFRLVTLQK